MQFSLAEAQRRLGELVRLAQQGEEVIITRDERAAVRLEPVATKPVRPPLSPQQKRELIEHLRAEVQKRDLEPGTDAARSQDFLYGDDGLPG